ncbi:MAG: glycosyltransferase [Bacteroidales bacterium]|nr:glycosyltransferase [Bacteroidales bacterium]
MKIVEIIPQLSSGGAERFVVDLCNELCKKHDVTLIVLHNIHNKDFYINEIDHRVSLLVIGKSYGFDFRLPFRLYRLIKNLRPDVVHTHMVSILYMALTLCFQKLPCKLHTVHNDARAEASGFVGTIIRRILFGICNVRPITISEESQRSFADYYNIESTLIYNGRPPYQRTSSLDNVYSEFPRLSKASTIIVNLARVSQQKNQIQLIEAVQLVREEGEDVELYIVGSIIDQEIYDSIVGYNYPFIHIIGQQVNPRDFIKDADAFCLSSLYEGMPISLIECFSVGTIPICTPVGGIINMIQDKVNGILAKNTHVLDIKNAILTYINMSEEEKMQMRLEVQRSYEKYEMDTCALRYETVMLQTIHGVK